MATENPGPLLLAALSTTNDIGQFRAGAVLAYFCFLFKKIHFVVCGCPKVVLEAEDQNRHACPCVIPAKAGIQILDPRVKPEDDRGWLRFQNVIRLYAVASYFVFGLQVLRDIECEFVFARKDGLKRKGVK